MRALILSRVSLDEFCEAERLKEARRLPPSIPRRSVSGKRTAYSFCCPLCVLGVEVSEAEQHRCDTSDAEGGPAHASSPPCQPFSRANKECTCIPVASPSGPSDTHRFGWSRRFLTSPQSRGQGNPKPTRPLYTKAKRRGSQLGGGAQLPRISPLCVMHPQQS